MKESEVENLLRDMQEYRELTNRLKAIFGDQMTLKDMVDVMERIIREPMKLQCGMNTGKSVRWKNAGRRLKNPEKLRYY